MKLSFWEKYGAWLLFFLFTYCAWRLVTLELHLVEGINYFFPLQWLSLTLIADQPAEFLAPYQSEAWWLWVEVGAAVLLWAVLFCSVRGIFFSLTESVDMATMWLVVVLMAGFIFLGFFFVFLS